MVGAMITKAEIKLTTRGTSKQCDEWAFAILGQDPMGELEVPIEIQIGTWVVHGIATGFTSGGLSPDCCDATITVYATDWEAR